MAMKDFVVVSAFFAMIGELVTSLLIEMIRNPLHYLWLFLFYPIYGVILYFASKRIRNIVLYYLIFSFIGLFIIEWIFLKNMDQHVFIQIYMFSFWSAVAMMPRVFSSVTAAFGNVLVKKISIISVAISITGIPVFGWKTGLGLGLVAFYILCQIIYFKIFREEVVE